MIYLQTQNCLVFFLCHNFIIFFLYNYLPSHFTCSVFQKRNVLFIYIISTYLYYFIFYFPCMFRVMCYLQTHFFSVLYFSIYSHFLELSFFKNLDCIISEITKRGGEDVSLLKNEFLARV